MQGRILYLGYSAPWGDLTRNSDFHEVYHQAPQPWLD